MACKVFSFERGSLVSDVPDDAIEARESPNHHGRHLTSRRVHDRVTGPDETLTHMTELFDEAPIPYIVTSPTLIIEEANTAAQHLFRRKVMMMRGKSLALMIETSERSVFRDIASRLLSSTIPVVRPMRLQPGDRDAVDSTLHASVVRDAAGAPRYVSWLFVAAIGESLRTIL